MQIILLEKVANLGNLGDVVKVKDGFARNFLIPTRQARRATAAAIQEFAVRRAELEKAAAEKLAAAQALGERLNGKTVRVAQTAGVDGRLFGSVTNADVAEGLTKLGFAIAKAQVRMPNGPLKTVGEFTVQVAAHTDVVVDVTVQVVPEAQYVSLPLMCGGRLGRNIVRRPVPSQVPAFGVFGLPSCSQPVPGAPLGLPRLCTGLFTDCCVPQLQCPRSTPPRRPRPMMTKWRACACRRTRSRPSNRCSAAC